MEPSGYLAIVGQHQDEVIVTDTQGRIQSRFFHKPFFLKGHAGLRFAPDRPSSLLIADSDKDQISSLRLPFLLTSNTSPWRARKPACR